MAAHDGAGGVVALNGKPLTSARGSSWRLLRLRLGRGGRASARAERQSRFQMDMALARGLARSAGRASERKACRGRATGEGRTGLRPGEAA